YVKVCLSVRMKSTKSHHFLKKWWLENNDIASAHRTTPVLLQTETYSYSLHRHKILALGNFSYFLGLYQLNP
ncbi:MAG: hypothetical protein UHK99_10360, partial [Lacticaseibacillus paracasei]|nr:hypothetical protein [Lacticaseibacillus paracasei]